MPFVPPVDVSEIEASLLPSGITVQSRIDGGGQGDVFLCDHQSYGRSVVKVFIARARPRVDAEVSFLSTVQNQAIVRLLARGDIALRGDSCPFTVMEFVPGDSLRIRINRGQIIDEGRARRVVSLIAGAIEAMWNANKVHRDIKPDNILMEANGTSKLIDFGMVRHLDLPTMTALGAAPGTSGYKSPEHDSAIRNPTFKADVYSLGVTVYEAMSGVHPFGRDQDAMTRGAIAPDIRGVAACSDPFADVIARMLDPRAVMRPGLPELMGVA